MSYVDTMRPPRVILLVLCFAATSFLLFRTITALARATILTNHLSRSSSRISNLFSFTSPLTLFPPNAVISLTDDNSTSFPARPAAFGPPLPLDGLSGQLWIGSGFADDNLQEGEGEGELGCSDIPGWEDGVSNGVLKFSPKTVSAAGAKDAAAVGKSDQPKRRSSPISPLDGDSDDDSVSLVPDAGAVDDGTDDYLQQGIADTPKRAGNTRSSTVGHADIQSIQEAAEINGKIVLLSRGGCGFLEKVKWAQRRGATALIVGDNRKGGPLIQMFARGDTSNVTIPSVFTARTTAHLLSSLTQPGSFIEDTIDENGRPSFKVQQSDQARKRKKKLGEAGNSDAGSKYGPKLQGEQQAAVLPEPQKKRGWFSWLFRSDESSTLLGNSRATSSDPQDWVVVEDWDENNDKLLTDSLAQEAGFDSSTGGGSEGSLNGSPLGGSDGEGGNGASGGDPTSGNENGQAAGSKDKGGFFSKLFGGSDDSTEPNADTPPSTPNDDEHEPGPGMPEREGLWVTVTPTSSAGSFFDTLLILVISPLITLTVVYTLLIVRARIRRRRWRAPKSVVDRLPVRTYHTVAATPVHSPRIASPTAASPTTPLLQGAPSRSRPRSQTATGVPESSNFLAVSAPARIPVSVPGTNHDQAPKVSSEWRKYMGRQVECVVCLEEYIDGVSQVMSLPCGHEFHAECITPWLTTRRRTCPICKGDVVRSLARGIPSSPRYDRYESSDEESIRPPARNNSGPLLRSSTGNRESELERGISTFPPFPSQTPVNRIGAWFGSFTGSFGSTTPTDSPSPRGRSP